MSLREARLLASSRADNIMSKLAALHNPDMISGGYNTPDPTRIGRADVNSSIGSSWNQKGRVASIDEQARIARDSGKGGAKLNLKLQVCRGRRRCP
jgi:hypothetical protein